MQVLDMPSGRVLLTQQQHCKIRGLSWIHDGATLACHLVIDQNNVDVLVRCINFA